MAGGRPIEYKDEYVELVKKYIDECEDEFYKETKSESGASIGYELKIKVKIPTIEGLALYLDISKNTIYEWESRFPEFSDVIGKLREKQANALINKGLSGDYNPTIAKVLLTKHGYREGQENYNANSNSETMTEEQKSNLNELLGL